jgi:hypothetical protein
MCGIDSSPRTARRRGVRRRASDGRAGKPADRWRAPVIDLRDRSVLDCPFGDFVLPREPREPLAALNPAAISQIFWAVVAVTRESGGSRRKYPTRSIWPVVIILTSGRPFAIVDDAGAELEDPREPARIAEFIGTQSANGVAFEARLLQMLRREDLAPGSMNEFPGFPPGTRQPQGTPTPCRADRGLSRRA